MTTPDRPTAFHPLSWAYHALTSAREMSRNQPARWDQPTRWELGTQLRDALAAANPSDGTPPSTSGTLLGVRFVVSEVLSGYGWRILDTFGVAIVEGVARAADVPVVADSVTLSSTYLRYVAEALNRAAVRCPYHGTEFERAGMQWGEPRCDSCKQPWRIERARGAVRAAVAAALARPAGVES